MVFGVWILTPPVPMRSLVWVPVSPLNRPLSRAVFEFLAWQPDLQFCKLFASAGRRFGWLTRTHVPYVTLRTFVPTLTYKSWVGEAEHGGLLVSSAHGLKTFFLHFSHYGMYGTVRTLPVPYSMIFDA